MSLSCRRPVFMHSVVHSSMLCLCRRIHVGIGVLLKIFVFVFSLLDRT